MSKKTRTRVTYVVKDDYSASTHTAGINCFALDKSSDESGVLYSGGRDSSIYAWEYAINIKENEKTEAPFLNPDIVVHNPIVEPTVRRVPSVYLANSVVPTSPGSATYSNDTLERINTHNETIGVMGIHVASYF